ncbi:MAG: hypothetical protein GY835_04045 [bacterium]|nr:hypothetical protein [bacterium]
MQRPAKSLPSLGRFKVLFRGRNLTIYFEVAIPAALIALLLWIAMR